MFILCGYKASHKILFCHHNMNMHWVCVYLLDTVKDPTIISLRSFSYAINIYSKYYCHSIAECN